jgi:hypothetical protein
VDNYTNNTNNNNDQEVKMATFSYQIEVDIYKDHLTSSDIDSQGYNLKYGKDYSTKIVDVEVVGEDHNGNTHNLDDSAIDKALDFVGWTAENAVIIKDLYILTIDKDGKNMYTIQ